MTTIGFLTAFDWDVHYVVLSGGKWKDTPDEPPDVEITRVYLKGTNTPADLGFGDMDALREHVLERLADNPE